MKIIREKAILAMIDNGDFKWLCPTCESKVDDIYVCCPYCGQKLKFPDLRDLRDKFSKAL